MQGPAAATTAPPVRTEHRPARWVRTRLRAAPWTALLNGVLVFVVVLLSAGLPRGVDRGEDAALRDFLRDRGIGATSLVSRSDLRPGDDSATLASVAAQLTARTGGEFRVSASGPVYGVRGVRPKTLGNPQLSRPDGPSPRLELRHLAGLSEHTTLVEGRWPTAAPGRPLPIVVAEQTAEKLNIRVGDVLTEELGPGTKPSPATEVVGTFRVNDDNDPYWTDLYCLRRPCLEIPQTFEWLRLWSAVGLTGGDELPRLREWAQGGELSWRLPVDPSSLRADRLPDAAHELASYLSGPTAADLAAATGRSDLRTFSSLPDLFALATARRDAAAPLAALGPAGLAGVVTVVLCLAAALAADRRGPELLLLQARGGSRREVLRRLLGEGAAVVLPGAALGTLLALLLLPTPRWGAALFAAVTATLCALLAFPARALILLTPRRAVRRGGARRLVGELGLLLLTAAAVVEVRRRGAAPPGAGIDPLLVAAPLLIALCTGLLLARIQPPLIGALARAVGRRRGAVGFLGLAGAARGAGGRPRPAVLPTLALLLAVTTAGFGADVIGAVDSGRAREARLATGGDVMVSAPKGFGLADSFAERADRLPGVRAATNVTLLTDAAVLRPDRPHLTISLVVVDPTAYAEISRSLGRGAFDPAQLAAPDGPTGPDAREVPVPALYSRGLVEQLGGRAGAERIYLTSTGELRAQYAGTIDATPALRDSTHPFVVLPAGPATARVPGLGDHGHWFAVGDIDETAVRSLTRDLPVHPIVADTARRTGVPVVGPNPGDIPDGYLVRTSAALTAELTEDPLRQAAVLVFRVGTAGAGAFALLAALLTLVRAAPDRSAALARLRTMGLRPRQGLALILVETLPQTLLAAAGGLLASLAAVVLLGPALDLSALLGTDVPPGLPLRPGAVLPPALALTALVTAGVLAEALIAGRRQIAKELRAGDTV
ncbi:hypothetical protein [Kitasatospora purpeofusca]|uniref:hypothetical protein n=1 Tax=Kitasatospora purpeofusca TaxID=67352 RepID=UPI000AFB9C9B|nr:hypothetical protein [Kitasatospora purpeofusca]